ncbi:uncharacterized protein LOC109793732 [Cajanus cajan]|uniref:uncharacterized protein LOC109793732 n=1 Tax=Cajanus cajan TaxID=3821 RepID=UPI00098D9B5B|nr:uncharacterized protein LOC109793732 [Cajanus cajan]
MWDVVEQRNYIPLDQAGNKKPRAQWTEEQKQRFVLNSKAHNALMCALSEEEYTKVHSFRSAKQILPRKWRPQVTTFRASKNMENLSLEELIGLLKVHELELQQDDAGRK